MTKSLERQVKSYNGSMYQTCSKELNDQFDNCIYSEVSSRMNKTYNCTFPMLPFLGNEVRFFNFEYYSSKLGFTHFDVRVLEVNKNTQVWFSLYIDI